MKLSTTFTFFIIISACAISSVKSSAENIEEDGNSVAALAHSMNEKFQQLFHKFAQLDMKVDKILENRNARKASSAEKQVDRDDDRDSERSQNSFRSDRDSMDPELWARLMQADRLEIILSQSEHNL